MVKQDDVPADFSIPKWERFMKGLALICKYDPDPDFAAEHDIFYFGDFALTFDKMTDDEQHAMFTYNWTEAEDAWAFFP